MRAIETFIVVIILLGSSLQFHFVGPSAGQSGQSTYFGFYWDQVSDRVTLINRTTDTKQLVIEPIGAPFVANISFKCPEDFICPVKKINGIEIIPGKRVLVNFTYTAILKDNLLMDTDIIATLWNETVSVDFNAELSIRVIFPVSLEYLGNYSTKLSAFEGISFFSYHWKKTNILARVKITNYDTRDTLKGYFGAHVGYLIDGAQSESLDVFNDALITLPPLKSTIIDLNIPKSYSEKWYMAYVWFMFSPNKNAANASSTWFSNNTVVPNYVIGRVSVMYYIFGGLAINIKAPANGDIWNGTNITVTIFNGGTTPLRGFYVDILDTVGPYTAFDYARYSNVTKVFIGDIEPDGWTSVNVTIYSKVSGWHTIRAEEHGGKKAKISIETSVFISSGIGVAFLGEVSIGQFKINDTTRADVFWKNVEKGKETTLTMQIDNPRGYVGDISLSIYETGWDDNLANHHGNGWIEQEIFAHIEPKSIRIQKSNETVTFKIVPKTTGTLYIIPHIMVNGKLLLFDYNTKLQMWRDRCIYFSYEDNLPDQSDKSRTTPTVCAGYSYKAERDIEIQSEFFAIAIISIMLSCVVTGINFYRRFKQEKGYLGKNVNKKENGTGRVGGKEPKKRTKDNQ